MELLIGMNFKIVNSPLVIVPVLSKAATLIPASASRTSPPFIRSPFLAAFSSPQNVATGVDNTNAHGHALTNKTNANLNQCFF